MSFRAARSADLERLLEIDRSWPTTPGWSRQGFEAELGRRDSRLVVAEEGGRVQGYACWRAVPPEARILSLAVSREAAGQGLGRRLMRHLLDEARMRGLEKATLEVSAANQAAYGLYVSTGFSVVGRRPKFYNDGSDAILMDAPL